MLEEYERDTNPAITITSNQFKVMPEWDQREVLNKLLLEANNTQNEEARRAIQDKYRDLLATQLKTKGQMIIDKNIEIQLSKNQLQIRTKPPSPRLELPKTGYKKEYQYSESPRLLPKSLTVSDKSSTNQTNDSDASEKKRWILSITERLRSGSSKQHIHSPKKPSSLRNSVDLTNTPDIVLLTPIPIQTNQQIQQPNRNSKRPIDRKPQQIQIQSTFKGQPYTVYLSPAWNQPLEIYTENQPQASVNTEISISRDESDNESLTKEQQEFLEKMDEKVQEHIKNNNLHI
ncbi:7088_t:CDS:2 [Dentiscutata heterogama]|uniref:7088_t:CDS:1 n=1 Tax=Dentiscutata heterogama TaxID=1316150 RepID=A0ACA9K3E6_9GLOM|nr:7088_t:CDS:2 [Dentiscutata heterogama]